MTHAESIDLLLDLVYGELDAARSAEVQSHLAGCEDCKREKEALEQSRKAAAPLAAQEEPGEGFDEPILAAARAQAHFEHDGNLGQVVEVQGSVQPLGLQPARIDAHGPVSVRRVERRRPRWMTRAVLGGSVAAAAALALVVSTTLQNRQVERRTSDDAFQIRARPAEPAPAAKSAAPTALEAAPVERQQPARAKAVAKKTKDAPPMSRLEGSGGDAEVEATRDGRAAAHGRVAELKALPPPAPAAEKAESAHADLDKSASTTAMRAAPPPAAAPATAAPMAAQAPQKLVSNAVREAEGPSALEQRAQEARHAGNYTLAAALYRRAAALHRADATQASSLAAWDLAHAVECLAAAGQFVEAGLVRDELLATYPSEDAASSAAGRALRAAPAEVAPKAEPADR